MRLLPLEEHHHSARIAPQDLAGKTVEIGMNLEERLMADVPAGVGRQRKIAAAGFRTAHLRLGEIVRIVGKSDEAFRVVPVRVGGLQPVAREKIVDRWNPGRDGMPESHALHAGQAGKGEEIRPGVHSDIGVQQDVELTAGNLFARLGDPRREQDGLVGRLLDSTGDDVVGAGKSKHRVRRLPPRKRSHQTRIVVAHRMVMKEP